MSLAKAIIEAEQLIAEQNLSIEDETVLSKRLDLTFDEHAYYQERKSLALAIGVLALPVAQELYRLLGETPQVFNSQSLATKVVVTQVMAQILGG